MPAHVPVQLRRFSCGRAKGVTAMASERLEVRLRWRGGSLPSWYEVIADPEDADDMRKLVAQAVRRDHGWEKRNLGDYEVEVRMRDTRKRVGMFVPLEV